MPANNALETSTLSHFFGKGAFTPSASFDIALLTGAPAETDTPSTWAVEATYNGYARENTLPSDWGTPIAGDPSTIQNSNEVQFASGGSGANQTVTHFAIILGPNEFLYAALQNPLTVTEGVAPRFQPGNLIATNT